MMERDSTKFLVSTMEENWRLASQAEDKRATVAIVNLCIVSAVHAILAFTGFGMKTLPLTIWMILLGVYGILTSLKLYERSHYHILRARKLRAHFDECCPDTHVEQQLKEAENEHNTRYPRMINVRLNALWLGLHSLIAALGLLYTIISFMRS